MKQTLSDYQIVSALSRSDKQLLKQWLQSGYRWLAQGEKQTTVLIEAAKYNNVSACRFLLDYAEVRADLNAENSSKYRALDWALHHQNSALLRILLKAGAEGSYPMKGAPFKVNPLSAESGYPLDVALNAEDGGCAIELIDGSDWRKSPNASMCALRLSYFLKDEKRICSVLNDEHCSQVAELFSPVKGKSYLRFSGDTILHVAAKRGKLKVMESILAKFPDLLNKQNPENGQTPLSAALNEQQEKAAHWLLDRGASADRKEERGMSALLQATRAKMTTVARRLMTEEACQYEDKEGNTALHWACIKENEELFLNLLPLSDHRHVNKKGDLCVALPSVKGRSENRFLRLAQAAVLAKEEQRALMNDWQSGDDSFEQKPEAGTGKGSLRKRGL